MKIIALLSLIFCFYDGFYGNLQAHAADPSLAPLTDASVQMVTLTPEQAFAPTGFDSNDNVQVVLAGSFPNTCYKVAPPRAEIDTAHKKIVLENMAYHYASAWCLQVVVPYTQVVNLGVLDEGDYDIEVKDTKGALHAKTRLPVAQATSSNPDDYLYADVQDATVDGRTIRLHGTLDYDCYEFQEVRVIHHTANVVEVLPILKNIDPSKADCKPTFRTFVQEAALPEGLTGKTLIHIRSLNGQSINRVVDFNARAQSVEVYNHH